uniref:RING-type E3 ubiquitin transferase n=1 Tax=Ciona savignyi TaxID=51511 RepID=H2YPU2_CIOSA
MVSVPDCLERISAVLRLVGQLETTGSPPASKRTVENLPIVVIHQSNAGDERQCSICMEEFKEHAKATELRCSHVFHVSCITPWLDLHSTCPICRKPVDDQSCPVQIARANYDVAQSSQASGPSTTQYSTHNYFYDFSLFSSYG